MEPLYQQLTVSYFLAIPKPTLLNWNKKWNYKYAVDTCIFYFNYIALQSHAGNYDKQR